MTVIVPKRKVWTRQIEGRSRLNLQNPITNGLSFVLSDNYAGLTQVGTGIASVKSSSIVDGGYYFNGTVNGDQYTRNLNTQFGGSISEFYLASTPSTPTGQRQLLQVKSTGNLCPIEFHVGDSSVNRLFPTIYRSYNGVPNDSAFRAQTAIRLNEVNAIGHRSGPNVNSAHSFFVNNVKSAGVLYFDGGSSSTIIDGATNNIFIGASNTNASKWIGNIYLIAVWNRELSDEEFDSLYKNPWQLFAPRRQLLYVSATSVQLSYLRPASDITTGSWSPSTSTTLYGVLDEVVPDDADYIQASTATGCEIKLSAGSTPTSRDNHAIKYRLLAGSGNIAVVLKCGSTTIKSWNHTLTGSAQDFSQALSNAEATTITDYSDLRVTFTSS